MVANQSPPPQGLSMTFEGVTVLLMSLSSLMMITTAMVRAGILFSKVNESIDGLSRQIDAAEGEIKGINISLSSIDKKITIHEVILSKLDK
jgi:hypothetical protein